MGNTKNTKWINEESFKQMKALLSAGLTPKQVAEFTGKSMPTLNRVVRAKDFTGYKAIVKKHTNPHNKPVTKEAPKSVEVPRQDSAPQERKSGFKEIPTIYGYESPRTMAALNRIGDQLERLADAWEAQPEVKKTSFFGSK